MLTTNLTKISNLSIEEFEQILTTAQAFYRQYRDNIRRRPLLEGKVVALVFEKPSLRTKVSFEVAVHHLGGYPVFLSSEQILSSGGNQRGRESVPDIGRNLERFCDLIVARVYSHSTIETLANSVGIPVINALCDEHHPCQALADMLTIQLYARPAQARPVVAYLGDGNNVATSLMQACAMRGYDFRTASPLGFEIPRHYQDEAQSLKSNSAQQLWFGNDPHEVVKGADVVYTDTFVSMGKESERLERAKLFEPYRVTTELMRKANPEAIFLHCLPAHRGEEVTDEVMDSPRSRVFDQAECRLHVAKALVGLFLAAEDL